MTKRAALSLGLAAVLAAEALVPVSTRELEALAAVAMLAALGIAGDRLVRWLCPGFEPLSRATAAFTFAVALAVAPATWMGHFGVMRPAPFLLWVAAALLLTLALPDRRPAPEPAPEPGRRERIETALLIAVYGAVALVLAKAVFHYRWDLVGLGPDDESYHLTAMAVWQRFGDLRMVKFAIGDTSTTFYPVGGEVWSWALLAPFRTSDVLARWAQLPFALVSLAATAAIGRRLGLPPRSALAGAALFAAIRRAFPVLALSAGNDHSASFFTLAALDASLALAAAPSAGAAVYAGAALGLLLGTKYTALLFAPTLLAVLALTGLAERLRAAPGDRRPFIALAGLALALALAAAATGGYTYLRNWVTAGNPVFPAPVELFGTEIFPGWEGASLASRRQAPEFRIDVWDFLLNRRDLLGSFFPYTMLPAALLAPLVALWKRRWEAVPALLLPSLFFLEFLYGMHDHRDMRYFLPGVAIAAAAFLWLLERLGERGRPVRVLLLLLLTFHVARKLSLGGVADTAIALALIGLGAYAVRRGTLAVRLPRWAPAAAVVVLLIAALPLGALVAEYQAVKQDGRPPALALERLTGGRGASVAYAGLNKPYTFFGSRLQNAVQIAPRYGELGSQYYSWGGTLQFPYRTYSYIRWRRVLDKLGVRFVVVHRSPWEDPEREWMTGRPGAFKLEYFSPETEIWRIVDADERARRRGAARHRGPEPGEEEEGPTPAPGNGPTSSSPRTPAGG